ncbi:MAG: DEAD/DEAH box helicase, partial [Candidatus Omnitrophica bacterium]|nr:DEAD/DEAH box helicase [Candidatus Omnitrophota bacterium]
MPRIKSYEIDLVKHEFSKMLLYPHQSIMLDEWHHHDNFILMTKTGTGKTLAAVFPLLKYKERAILVYPTNELISD